MIVMARRFSAAACCWSVTPSHAAEVERQRGSYGLGGTTASVCAAVDPSPWLWAAAPSSWPWPPAWLWLPAASIPGTASAGDDDG